MDIKIIEDLVCPLCQGKLKISDNLANNKDLIDSGNIICGQCNQKYDIIDGVPKFVVKNIMQDEETVDGWGQQWQILSPEINEYFYKNAYTRFEEYSLTSEFFQNKKVLDVGCGSGRWSKIAAERNPKLIFALDLSAAIFTAKKNLSDYKFIHFFLGDMAKTPFQTEYFDFINAVEVLQHTDEPLKTLKHLVSLLKKGGYLTFSLYNASADIIWKNKN
ncbi:MAG TPA: methyltransferase domain-containing protein [bacterium]|nr:methyltransferase domain-containing protein [bacterium]